MPPPEPPLLRADAARNRGRILDAARSAFADPEADVSMAEVARRAGVGAATLYRNFANRRALLEALYLDEVDALVGAVHAPGESPGTVFVDWVGRFYAYFTSKRVVAEELLTHASADDPFFGAGRARVMESGRPLLEAAQLAGEIRSGLTLEQVLDLVVAVAKIPGDDRYRAPILAATLDALRAV